MLEEAGRLSPIMRPSDVADAPLADLLLHGLSSGDHNPAHGVFEQAEAEVRAVASLLAVAASCQNDTPDLGPVAVLLEGVARRLDVGLQLLHREALGRRHEAPAV